jgi:hypothetical protein
MGAIFSDNLVPPLTHYERDELSKGRAIARNYANGVVVVPKNSSAPGCRGANGEDAFWHTGGQAEHPSHVERGDFLAPINGGKDGTNDPPPMA